MYGKMKNILTEELSGIRNAGLWKEEWPIQTPQAAEIRVPSGKVLNFCANNYLGLSSHPKVLAAAKRALDERGYGMSSVRFICGTQDIHAQLEEKLAKFLLKDDCILYSSCFDANGGLFETLLGSDDAVISDALNHASIIDGVRLCKAERHRFANNDMNELEDILKKTQNKRLRLIAVDGVFSMDGYLAKLKDICDLAGRYDALTMVDDSHATGFIGRTGRGTQEHWGVMDRIDIITSTLGKALGGASGGFTCAHKEIIEILRQRSRPYLFSNALAPVIVIASMAVVDLLTETTELRDRLEENSNYFRSEIQKTGYTVLEGVTPIVPIMLFDAKLAADIARDMLTEGVYVKGFSYPVVPKDKARIRVQISAGHTREHLDRAVAAFTKIGKKHGVLK